MSELSAKKHKALKLGAAAIGITGCAGIIMNRLVLTRASKRISEMREKREAKKNAGAPVPEKDLLRQQSEALFCRTKAVSTCTDLFLKRPKKRISGRLLFTATLQMRSECLTTLWATAKWALIFFCRYSEGTI